MCQTSTVKKHVENLGIHGDSFLCGFLKDVRTFSADNDEGLQKILRNITAIKASLAQQENTSEKAA